MQTQRVFQAGNSNVVAIPKSLMRDVGFKSGQKVMVEKTQSGDAIIIKKAIKAKTAPRTFHPVVSHEFKKWLDQFMEENGGILDELAVR